MYIENSRFPYTKLYNLQKALNKGKKHFGLTNHSKDYGTIGLQLADIEKLIAAKPILKNKIYSTKYVGYRGKEGIYKIHL